MGSLPVYEVELNSPYFTLLSDGAVQPGDINKNRVFVPMLDMGSEWIGPYRKEPELMQRYLNNLIKVTSENTKHQMNATSFKDANKLAKSILWDLEIPYGYNMVLCSEQTLINNAHQVHEYSYYESILVVDWLPLNKFVFIPDAEFVGVLPVRGTLFGAFAIPTNIITVTIV